MDLPFDDHWIDNVAAVVHGDEPPHLHLTGALVDVHHADVRTEGEGEVRRIVVVGGLQSGLHAGRVVGVGGQGNILDGLVLVGSTLHPEAIDAPLEVVFVHFQQIGRDLLGFCLDFVRRHGARRAGRGRGAAGVGAQPVGRGVGIPLLDLDVRRGQAEFFGDDLRVGCLLPLALRLVPKRAIAFPVGWIRISAESNVLMPGCRSRATGRRRPLR